MRRRDLLKGVALVVPVAVGLPAAPAFAQSAVQSTDRLTTLLNWKYAQAELYRQGNAAELLSGIERDYFNQIAQLKQGHVAALTQALTAAGAPVPAAPALDFAAGYTTRDAYLDTAYQVEDVIMRSYLGTPPTPTEATEQVFWNVAGMGMTDARTVAMVGAVANKPVVGGILFSGDMTPTTLEQVLAVLRPYVTSPWAVAGSAAITE
jgi:ferritin-like protein